MVFSLLEDDDADMGRTFFLGFMADVMALCAGIRPVVMVDYGGKLPELQQHLCALLRFCRKVWSSVHMFSATGSLRFYLIACGVGAIRLKLSFISLIR